MFDIGICEEPTSESQSVEVIISNEDKQKLFLFPLCKLYNYYYMIITKS